MKLLSVLVLGFFLSDASAFLPLLGDVEHPLLHWGPQHLMKLLDLNSTPVKDCIQSSNAMVAMNTLSKASACASSLGEQAGQVPSPEGICSAQKTFARCFHGAAIEITAVCKFSQEEIKHINDSVKNNGDILRSLCEDNAEKVMSYQMFEGMDCATKKRDALHRCADENRVMGEPRYNREGCTSAANFMDCAAKEIGGCSEKAGRILGRITEGALEDLCRDQTGGVGQLPPEFGENNNYDESGEHHPTGMHHQTRMHQSGMHHQTRMHQSGMGGGKYEMMQRQTELMEEMNKSLKAIISILNRNNQLLEMMTQN